MILFQLICQFDSISDGGNKLKESLTFPFRKGMLMVTFPFSHRVGFFAVGVNKS